MASYMTSTGKGNEQEQMHFSSLFWIIVALTGLLLCYYGKVKGDDADARVDLEKSRKNPFRH